jgi:hypothetical protein
MHLVTHVYTPMLGIPFGELIWLYLFRTRHGSPRLGYAF